MRRALFFFAWAAILAAAVVVPVPFVAIEPGGAYPVPPRVTLGIPPDPINGQLLLTAVRISEPSTVGTLAAWVDDETDVIPRPAVIPPGVDEEEYVKTQQRLFRESAQVAAAVGLQKAGYQVEVTGGGAQVAAVIAGSPAAGKLREGDVIIAVDGRRVHLATDVAKATARSRPGDEVTVTFRRDDEVRRVRIRLREVSELGRPGLGVAVRTLDFNLKLPFPVDVDQGQIGGPSAGLMLALTIYDLADPGDLARGRTIAGTGTIDLAGTVGAVGGVRQKVEAAEESGAEVFLVPAGEAEEALDAAGDSLKVLAVDTMDEALEVLRS